MTEVMGMLMAWGPLVLAGLGAGLLAGLFGVGGGVVVVPAVYAVLLAAGTPPALAMKLALGTSLASIVFTGAVSASRHHRRGAVDGLMVAALAPGLVIGAIAAGAIAHLAPGELLRTGFALFLLLIAFQLARGGQRELDEDHAPPPALALLGVGLVFGLISGLAGVGGGTLVVPFLLWSGLRMVDAVGTAAACGVAIALAGALSYMVAGYGDPMLPSTALGYVDLPALIAVVAGSVLAAPLGVRLAHRLPAKPLRLSFSVLLVGFSAAMLLH